MIRFSIVVLATVAVVGCGSETLVSGDPGSGGGPSTTIGGAGGLGGGGTGGSGGEAGNDDPCGCPAGEVCHFGACEPRQMVRVDVFQIDHFLGQPDTIGAAFIQTFEWMGEPTPDPPEYSVPPNCGYKLSSSGHLPTTLDIGEATLLVAGGPTLSFPPLVDGASNLYGGFSLDPGVDLFEVTTTGGVDVEPFSVTFSQPEPIVVDPLPPLVPGDAWTVTWSGETDDASLNLHAEGQDDIQCFSQGPSSATIPAELTAMLAPGTKYGVELIHWGERKIDELPSGVGVITHPYRWHRMSIDVSGP